ncbi:MAG TPA: DEAD/DEAH box helicase [Myxococcota bacterium]|nr:DEAD/DEAH box helicase [Myxococcota bacterium]
MTVGQIKEAIAGLGHDSIPEGETVLSTWLPAHEARLAPPPAGLHPDVLDFLSRARIESLYSHQARACELSMAGSNVILSTSTASGKTLAFTLPVLHELATDPDACALFLYPLKALTNDQLDVFSSVQDMSGVQIDAAIYDGDTPRASRPRIRQLSRVILSNPWEIHETLPYHHLWRRFFLNLRYVVIDEAHRYTGVFGSNVAQVIRRLARVASVYGASPRFILASASIPDASRHALALTGHEAVCVDDDGSPAGEKALMVVNAGLDGSGSPAARTRDIVAGLVRRGIKTLCFTRSRRTAELVASLSADRAGGLPISPYRAGYLPAQRRQLEQAFRDGSIRGVVSTNALELGIDIGDLDAVVVSGYPGSVSAFWQQVGRAGRRGGASAAIFVAGGDILDQYLASHTEILTDRVFERATIDLHNPHILAGHALCAASELPLKVDAGDGHLYGIAKSLAGGGLLRETVNGFIYGGSVRPQEAVRLDRIGSKTVSLVDGRTADLLENLDFDRALREAFVGAVYMHQAATWIVRELDLEALRAVAERQDVDYFTVAHQERQVEMSGDPELTLPGHPGVWSAGLGGLSITHTITHYLKKRYGNVIGSAPLDLPRRVLETTGFWIDFPASEIRGVIDLPGAMHALEHTIVGISPIAISCDPDDLAGFSTMMAPHSGAPAIFVYDGYDGGLGLSERAFRDLPRLVAVALDILQGCRCASGCPACCLSPRCGNNNQPMDKQGAITLARQVLGL